jgi:hypothetical protein
MALACGITTASRAKTAAGIDASVACKPRIERCLPSEVMGTFY